MIVHRLLNQDDINANLPALAEWVTAHGLDPRYVAPEWLAIIEHDDSSKHLHYKELLRVAGGMHAIDPEDPSRAWSVERTVPLAVDLPCLSRPADRPRDRTSVTEGDGHPGGSPLSLIG